LVFAQFVKARERTLVGAKGSRQPAGNQFWKAKIRQVLQSGFVRRGIGNFAVAEVTALPA